MLEGASDYLNMDATPEIIAAATGARKPLKDPTKVGFSSHSERPYFIHPGNGREEEIAGVLMHLL